MVKPGYPRHLETTRGMASYISQGLPHIPSGDKNTGTRVSGTHII